MSNTLRSNEILPAVCEALGLPYTRVYRLTIELTAGQPAFVGVEMRPEKEDGEPLAGAVATVVERHTLTKMADAPVVVETAE